MKKSFVMLVLLSDLWKDDPRWQANVADNIPDSESDGFTMKMDGEDGDGEPLMQEFACDELEFVGEEVTMYDFAGGEMEAERFYPKDVVIYRVKATGELCVMDSEGLYEF